MYYYGPMDGDGWGLSLLMILVWVLVLAVLAAIAIRYLRVNNSGRAGGNESPQDIAKARYAKGEITKEQFEQLKKDLKK